MKCYNCYFSPTGGTRKVAQTVADGLSEAAEEVDLFSGAIPCELTGEDICLVAVPSYGGRVPAPAAEQIRRMEGNGAKAVLVAVFGNRAIDDTLLELYDLLTEAGFCCIAGMEAVAQHSLISCYGAGRPDAEDLKQLRQFAGQIREALEQERDILQLPGSRPYREYNGVPLKPAASRACVSCGRCAAECPVGAIPASNCRITDTKKCISCMHCAEICPVHARKLNKIVLTVAKMKMKKTCSDRKQNKLYL